MSEGFTTSHLKSLASRLAAAAEACAAELNAADAQLGDGDLGITVAKGWRQIATESAALPDDVGMAFLKWAQAFQKVSSSSYGTLIATGFMSAAKTCKGRTDIPWSELSQLVSDAAAAMLARGKSSLGDKTVVDALDAIAKSTVDLTTPSEIKSAAISACDSALAEFKNKPNKVGRARMFAERSVGLDDPGMLALRRLLSAITLTLLLSAALLPGCDRKSAQPPATAPTIVFRSADGRTLTSDELTGVTGTFKYEIIGTENIPTSAKDLHQQAREAGGRGDYAKTIELLTQASDAAPKWPYPVYDMAYTYLLMNDPEKSRTYYRKTLELAPRGFFTAMTALDTLDREQKGEFPPGLYLAYQSLESMSSAERLNIARQLTVKQPNFAPGWKELAYLLDDDDEKLKVTESGLAANPDPETKGILLINKALIIDRQGKHDQAVQILGNLALDPQSTMGTEQLAKMTLAKMTARK